MGVNESSKNTGGKIIAETVPAKRVQIWAHRGASGYAPENTLEAFRLAADMDADGVELDVQLTKDGQLVVAHDEHIDRVSDGSGKIADYTLAELKTYNFNKTHPEYAGICRIPTLKEVLECLRDTRLTVNIELKTGLVFYDGIEQKTVELAEKMGFADRVIYSSFNHHSVLKIREYCPDAELAFLYSDGLLGVAEYALRHHIHAVNPSVSCTFFEDEMQACMRNHIKIHVWTANTKEEMQRLVKLGVDSIITNYPDKAKKLLV